MHRGAFCQFSFWWIYYYGSNKSNGKNSGKTHLCAMCGFWYAKLISKVYLLFLFDNPNIIRGFYNVQILLESWLHYHFYLGRWSGLGMLKLPEFLFFWQDSTNWLKILFIEKTLNPVDCFFRFQKHLKIDSFLGNEIFRNILLQWVLAKIRKVWWVFFSPYKSILWPF